jgi:hypothetical protein
MRVRYLIEVMAPGDFRPVGLAEIDREGEYVGGGSVGCADVEAAKDLAQRSASGLTLKWKLAPVEWQPDALLVSQYFEDEGWDQTRG